MPASFPLLFLLSLLCLLPGSLGCYYSHLAKGQAQILMARRSLESVLADPETDDALREKLRLVERTRAYAVDLGLEVEGQYTSYVPWPGDRIITSLVATEPGSVDARPFRFPMIGAVPYKGFFDQARAEQEADALRKEGLDVCLVAVPAYSTLGWFDDPVTDPMLRASPGRLVETVLHELVHATVFLESQPDFNEGVASFVGKEASIRFYSDQPELAQRRRLEIEEGRKLANALIALRDAISQLYTEEHTPEERHRLRAELEESTRAEIAALPLTTTDAARVARNARLNDACLALRGTYSGDAPLHRAVLERLDGDLRAFIVRLRSVAESDDPREAFFAPVAASDTLVEASTPPSAESSAAP